MDKYQLTFRVSARDRRLIKKLMELQREYDGLNERDVAKIELTNRLMERIREIKNAVFGFTTQKY